MEKFLSIPVLDAHGTNSQNQLVGITGILDISQVTSTRVDITFVGGKQLDFQTDRTPLQQQSSPNDNVLLLF